MRGLGFFMTKRESIFCQVAELVWIHNIMPKLSQNFIPNLHDFKARIRSSLEIRLQYNPGFSRTCTIIENASFAILGKPEISIDQPFGLRCVNSCLKSMRACKSFRDCFDNNTALSPCWTLSKSSLGGAINGLGAFLLLPNCDASIVFAWHFFDRAETHMVSLSSRYKTHAA